MILCSKCQLFKDVEEFHNNNSPRAAYRFFRQTLCRPCLRSHNDAWKKNNKERIKERARERYAERMQEDPTFAEKRQKKSASFYATHPDYARTWAKTHPERKRATENRYALKHPDKIKAKRRRSYLLREARKRSLPSNFSLAEEAFCRAYFHYACAACGNEEGFQWTISLDHWIPLSSPHCPGTVATNIIPLCNGLGGCNTRKQGKDPEQWLIERFGTRKAKQILQKIRAYFATSAST